MTRRIPQMPPEAPPSELRLLWWAISDAWKYVLSLVGLAMLGCSGGIGTIDTPGSCGLWDELRVYDDAIFEEYPNSCAWVYSEGTVLALQDDCPNEQPSSCFILLEGGTPIVAWTELDSGSSGNFGGAVTYPLKEDGSCPVSCEAEWGCSPSPLDPRICEPCTEDMPCG